MNDVNEYAPVFKEKSYKATVVEGRQYDSILRVEAVDADCSPQFSQICSYEIVTPDVPFTVDKDGENPEADAFLPEGQMGQAAPSTPVGFKPSLCLHFSETHSQSIQAALTKHHEHKLTDTDF